MACILIAAILCSIAKCNGQYVLCPAYSAQAGKDAVSQCPLSQLRNLWVIVNPNSGPGASVDSGYRGLIKLCNDKKVKVVYYIDTVAEPGDGLYSKTIKKHDKTPSELMDERGKYSKIYGDLQWDGWFFDMINPSQKEIFSCISNWPGIKFLNPGSKFNPPAGLESAIVVISEQAGAWPRPLTDWESKHKSQCAVIGLKINDLKDFLRTTSGLGFRCAYPGNDNWTKGQSVYNVLTPYFTSLF